MTSDLHVSYPATGAAKRLRVCLEAAVPAAPVMLQTVAAAADAAAVVVDGGNARAAGAVVELVLGAAAVVCTGSGANDEAGDDASVRAVMVSMDERLFVVFKWADGVAVTLLPTGYHLEASNYICPTLWATF